MDTYRVPRPPLQEPYYGKHLIFLASRKSGTQVVCHSALEADYCVHLEHNQGVVNYASQPGPFQIVVNGRTEAYTPDFYVEMQDTAFYTEVKPDFDRLSARCNAKLDSARQAFSNCGSSLRFADLNSIRPVPYLRNLKFLYMHSFNIGTHERGACARLLRQKHFPLQLRELIANDFGVRERAIYLAMFEEKIGWDHEQRLTLDSWLRVPSHDAD